MDIYYAENQERRGPFSLEQIASLNLPPETLVFYAGLGDWTPISVAPATASLYNIPNAPSGGEVVEDTVIAVESPMYTEVVEIQESPRGYYREEDQKYLYGEEEEKCPKTHLAWNIVNLVLFFLTGVIFAWIFSIPGIIFSARVKKLWNRGEYKKARSSSTTAKVFAIISTVIGILGWLCYLICFMIFGSIFYILYAIWMWFVNALAI